MSVIDERSRKSLTELFQKNLVDEVKLIVFTQEFECGSCKETRDLVQELAALSNKIKYEVYDFQRDGAKASELQIDKIPAVVVVVKKLYGIRFFGLPTGYEFLALVEDIVDVSKSASRISDATRNRVRAVSNPAHIQVFTTPTCPYCPRAVRTAHQLALENELVKADMVNAVEFPHLTTKYNVMAVPKIVVNEVHEFIGSLPEDQIMDQVMLGLGTPSGSESGI